MNDRPTPETDALEQKQASEGCPQWNDMMRWVREHAALARKLERERDEALEKIKQQKLEIVRLNGATNHAGGTSLKIALRELAEARFLLESEKITRNHIINRSVEVEKERDEERENCKSIVDKANELIARWDQPSWKDTAPTARFINALRIAVRAYEDAP